MTEDKYLDPAKNPFIKLSDDGSDPVISFLRGRGSWAIYADEAGQQFKGTMKLEEGGRVVVEAGGEVKPLSDAGEDILRHVNRDIAQAREDAGEKELSPFLDPKKNPFIKLD